MRKTYHLANLGEAVDQPKPARLAVLGYPVAHSASPQLHQAALDAIGIDCSYIRLEVEPGELPKAFEIMREMRFIGCNVTVPHKFEAMACCTQVSKQAQLLGAVNTIVFSENETLGFNTDGPGFTHAIKEAFDLNLADIHTLILGAGGGAGQAIATQCALQKPSRLTLANRSLSKIEILADRLRQVSPETDIRTITLDDSLLKDLCHEADLLVQTSSLGLKPGDPPVIPGNYLLPQLCAYDTIYEPAETKFLAAAHAQGVPKRGAVAGQRPDRRAGQYR